MIDPKYTDAQIDNATRAWFDDALKGAPHELNAQVIESTRPRMRKAIEAAGGPA